MNVNNNTPEIRFNRFSGDWVERNLSEVADYRNGKAHEQDISDKGRYIVVNSKFVSTDGKVKKFTERLIEPLYKNEIAFVLSDVPNGKAIAKAFLVKENNKFSLNQRIAGITPKHNTDPYFFYVAINRHSYFLKFDNGVSQTNLSKLEVENFPTNYPSLTEQSAIGNFSQYVDHTILLSRRKHEKTKTLKNAFLSKIFPQAGKKQPDIRLKGFSEDWVEKKLDEVVEIVGGGTPDTTNPEFWDGEIDWYSPTEIGKKVYADKSVKTITELGLQKSSAQILPAHETILFTSRAGIGDMAILRNEAATNQGFQSFIAKDIDVYFLYSMGHLLKEYALEKASGSTFLEISKKQLSVIEILIPSNTEEQTAIGNFFKQLDDTLALQAKQLKALENFKEALLAKMFV